jgi:hypothetical protein
MSDNDHPILHWAKEFDPEKYSTEQISRDFIRLEPNARFFYLKGIGDMVTQNDGVDLRKKAQLMRLRQLCKQIDGELRRAGR